MDFERRRYTRFSVPGNLYCVFYQYSDLMRKLRDISVAGLGYEYVSLAGSEPDAVVFDIFDCRSRRIHLPGVSCQKIYDITTLSEHGTFSGTETRLCGYQYVNLTNEQRLKLEVLLNRCVQC